jgi:hypothetical protein
MPSLENTLGKGYSAGGPQVLACFRSRRSRRGHSPYTQVGAGEMELPEPKEAVIDRFRAALEQQGSGTGGWWQRAARPVPDWCNSHVRLGEGARQRRRRGHHRPAGRRSFRSYSC